MNIDEINRKHFIKTDVYFRVGKGLSSELIKYEDGIIYVELEVRDKWTKNMNSAAWVVANSWKKEHEEFEDAIAAKVYIIDTRSYEYKSTLLNLGIKPGYDAFKGVFFK